MFYCLIKTHSHLETYLSCFEPHLDLIRNQFAILTFDTLGYNKIYFKGLQSEFKTEKNLILVYLRDTDFFLVSDMSENFLNNLSFQDYYLFKRAEQNSKTILYEHTFHWTDLTKTDFNSYDEFFKAVFNS